MCAQYKHQISIAGTKSTSFYFVTIQLGHIRCQPASPGCPCGTWWIWDSGALAHTSRSQHPRCCGLAWCLLAWRNQFASGKCSNLIGLIKRLSKILDDYVGTHGLCSDNCELRLSSEILEGPSWKLMNHHLKTSLEKDNQWTGSMNQPALLLLRSTSEALQKYADKITTSQSKNVQRCSECLNPQGSWNPYS